MKKLILIPLLIFGWGGNLFAQISEDSDYRKTMDFLQGDGMIDSGSTVFMDELRQSILPIFDIFITDAKAIAAVFMIIFFALKSYEMMSGDKKLEIMPLLRPFGLVMVILWWGTFVQIIAYPMDMIAEKAKEKVNLEQEKVNDLRYKRAEFQMKLANHLFSIGAEVERAKMDATEVNKNFAEETWDTVKGSLLDPVLELGMRINITMKLFVAQLMEICAVWILRIAVLLVLIIQVIYSSILIILGPFAVAVSILPAFRDSFATWIARFVAVNLYLGIAYIILLLVTVFQNYALQSEINKYTELLGQDGLTANIQAIQVFATNGVYSFGTVIIALLVGAIAMLTVPSISTWIISTSGVTSAASTAGRAAAGAGKGAAGAARKLITKI